MKEKSLTIVIPTLKRSSLKEAIASCGELPVLVEKDTHRTGAGPSRNRAIGRTKTLWVAFLDDDDQYSPDFLERFLEAERDGEPDVIIFRMQYPDGRVLPKVPKVIWGNVGIAFAVKTELAKKYPFVKGANGFEQNEDYLFLKTLEENGAKIVFSPHVVYLVKPSKEAQANANINNSSD